MATTLNPILSAERVLMIEADKKDLFVEYIALHLRLLALVRGLPEPKKSEFTNVAEQMLQKAEELL